MESMKSKVEKNITPSIFILEELTSWCELISWDVGQTFCIKKDLTLQERFNYEPEVPLTNQRETKMFNLKILFVTYGLSKVTFCAMNERIIFFHNLSSWSPEMLGFVFVLFFMVKPHIFKYPLSVFIEPLEVAQMVL